MLQDFSKSVSTPRGKQFLILSNFPREQLLRRVSPNGKFLPTLPSRCRWHTSDSPHRQYFIRRRNTFTIYNKAHVELVYEITEAPKRFYLWRLPGARTAAFVQPCYVSRNGITGSIGTKGGTASSYFRSRSVMWHVVGQRSRTTSDWLFDREGLENCSIFRHNVEIKRVSPWGQTAKVYRESYNCNLCYTIVKRTIKRFHIKHMLSLLFCC